MSDMSSVIQTKSDQLNADDLISGPMTIVVTQVHISAGQDQPVTVRYQNDQGKPWKPCKSMSRVLVDVWGPDASKYPGQAVTLYRDPTVKWGGMEVGGIRISHISGITKEKTIALTATRGKKAITKIKPLAAPQQAQEQPKEDKARAMTNALIEALKQPDALADEKVAQQVAWLRDKRPELYAEIEGLLPSGDAESEDDGPPM